MQGPFGGLFYGLWFGVGKLSAMLRDGRTLPYQGEVALWRIFAGVDGFRTG